MEIKKLYVDPKFASSFSGKKAFIKDVVAHHPTVKSKDVKKALLQSDSYTLHKPTKKPKVYRRIYTKGIGYLYQIDLVDMTSLSKSNNGYRWIITCIDTFSKKAFAFPTKNKTGAVIKQTLERFLTEKRPLKLELDLGSEFYNTDFLPLLRRLGIKWYSTYGSGTKNAIIERYNRTLKTRMYRAFSARGSHKWIDIIDDLVAGYNKSRHRSIGMAPNDVTKANEKLVYKTLFPPKITRPQSAVFKVGDSVRITRKKGTFEKGYEMTYTWEVFYISKVKSTHPITYGVRDYNGGEVKGSFYDSELQLVDKSDQIFAVEKIIRQRTRGNNTEYLVKWQGYSDHANSWVPYADLFAV